MNIDYTLYIDIRSENQLHLFKIKSSLRILFPPTFYWILFIVKHKKKTLIILNGLFYQYYELEDDSSERNSLHTNFQDIFCQLFEGETHKTIEKQM